VEDLVVFNIDSGGAGAMANNYSSVLVLDQTEPHKNFRCAKAD